MKNFLTGLKVGSWYKTPSGSIVKYLGRKGEHHVFLAKYTGNEISILDSHGSKPAYDLSTVSQKEVDAVKTLADYAAENKKERRENNMEARKERKAADKVLKKQVAEAKASKVQKKAEGKKGGSNLSGRIRDIITSKFVTVADVIKACSDAEEKRVKQIIRKLKRDGKVSESGDKFKVTL